MKKRPAGRLISLLLCALLCISLMPAEVFADADIVEDHVTGSGSAAEAAETADDANLAPQDEAAAVSVNPADLPEETEGPMESVSNTPAMASNSGTCGDNLTWALAGGTLTISGTGAMTNYSSSGNQLWISGKIKKVVISNDVTSIGRFAFKACTNLTSVEIASSVTTIGAHAFDGCSALSDVTLPNDLTTIAEYTFYGCALTNVTLPNSVISIGNFAFAENKGLTHISIPSGVTSIGEAAFNGCEKLQDITIPDGVTNISNSAFYNCSGLTSVTIPSSVTTVSEGAFSGTALAYVFYKGSEDDWAAITVGDQNTPLTSARVHYNSTGHSYSITDSASCTAAGTVTYTCSVCGYTYSEESPAGHTLTHTDAAAATCTTAGNIEYWACSRCGKFYSDSAATTEITEADTVIAASGHTYENHVCTTCGSVEEGYDGSVSRYEIEIKSYNLTIGSDLTMNFFVTNSSNELTDLENRLTMEFERNGKIASDTTPEKQADGRYKFSYEGINPQCMTDDVTVRLKYRADDGQGSSNVIQLAEKTYSVTDYCNALYNQYKDSYPSMMELTAYMLNYGAEAQKYTGYKSGAGQLATDVCSWASGYLTDRPAEQYAEPVTTQGENYDESCSFSGKAMVLSNVNYLKFTFTITGTASDYSVRLYKGDALQSTTNAADLTVDARGRYVLTTAPLTMKQNAAIFKVEIYQGDDLMLSQTYSGNYYLHLLRNSNYSAKDLAVSLYEFGCIAQAYNASA